MSELERDVASLSSDFEEATIDEVVVDDDPYSTDPLPLHPARDRGVRRTFPHTGFTGPLGNDRYPHFNELCVQRELLVVYTPRVADAITGCSFCIQGTTDACYLHHISHCKLGPRNSIQIPVCALHLIRGHYSHSHIMDINNISTFQAYDPSSTAVNRTSFKTTAMLPTC
ncbi:uncharacterized protein LOC135398018 isoform X2 [Ornithodoros turicata]